MLHDPQRLTLIAGPCALESEAVTFAVADALASLAASEPRLRVVFKGSYDKANRTSIHSPRGPGLEVGLRLLDAVKARTGLPVLTDIHTPEAAAVAGEVCDCLQIPAFLCRQTDLLVAAAATGRCVNVKKGQFLSPADMRHVVTKLRESGATSLLLTERGTTFGYQNLVVDMRAIAQMKALQAPVIFDATHSVQQPGAGDGKTIGQRKYAPLMSRAALAAGADGIFAEFHPDPDQAISDAANQLPLSRLRDFAADVLAVWEVARTYQCDLEA